MCTVAFVALAAMVSCKLVVQELKPVAGHSRRFSEVRTATREFYDDDERSNTLTFESLWLKLNVNVLCTFYCCRSLRMCSSDENPSVSGTLVRDGAEVEDTGVNFGHVEKSVQQALDKVRRIHGRSSVSV